jgi:hypothetical protein
MIGNKKPLFYGLGVKRASLAPEMRPRNQRQSSLFWEKSEKNKKCSKIFFKPEKRPN